MIHNLNGTAKLVDRCNRVLTAKFDNESILSYVTHIDKPK